MKNLNEEILRIKSIMGINENEDKDVKYTLYVDMGGVLFTKMGADEGGSGEKTEFIGKELWDGIKNYDPIILSATGSKDKETKKETKIKQVKRYLSPTPKIKFVESGVDKKEYSNKNSILIDDSQTNINSWKTNGGIGMKYDPNNTKETIESLKKYFK
jgi:hypothetical protein